jgi:hypothetical protein
VTALEVTAIEPVLVDFPTACKLLAISKDLLRQEMACGNIAAQTVASKVVFRPDELRRYAEARPAWEPK